MLTLKIYVPKPISETNLDDAVVVRYIVNGERHTTWFRQSSCRSLGLEQDKTYQITVEQLPDEYI